ncbi:MAG: hydroxymethylbilane synthase [Opitutaceae bacterium]|nr:hydroxymethylbilane synthase [Cytophagales bacterium]
MIQSKIKIGTRGSKLALWQANHIADLLKQNGIQSEIIIINTKGDKILDRSLAKIGSKGVFTEELEVALRNGDIDIAQHSAKDLQSHLPDDLELIAFTTRENPEDVVVSFNKNFSLTENGIIGTSSVRRVAFFKKFYPNLDVVDMRGNLQTRIEKLKNGAADALALAYAGVHRMGYENMIVASLPVDQFIPPVGQGSIAIEASKSLAIDVKNAIRNVLNDTLTEICLVAERSFLGELNGGCSIPAFCHATLVEKEISIVGGLISTDGKQIIKFHEKGNSQNGQVLGANLAIKVFNSGGSDILKQIRNSQAS